MKNRSIDFDEIQKAMEDTERDAFDYFLDTETGDVVVLSEEILLKAKETLRGLDEDDLSDFEEVVLDEEIEVPDWMEDEVELALDVFLDQNHRYRRIPERIPQHGFAAMRSFCENVEDQSLKAELLEILDGKGAFRRFKDALARHPKERKQWYRHNAKAAREEISAWLESAGILPETDGPLSLPPLLYDPAQEDP